MEVCLRCNRTTSSGSCCTGAHFQRRELHALLWQLVSGHLTCFIIRHCIRRQYCTCGNDRSPWLEEFKGNSLMSCLTPSTAGGNEPNSRLYPLTHLLSVFIASTLRLPSALFEATSSTVSFIPYATLAHRRDTSSGSIKRPFVKQQLKRMNSAMIADGIIVIVYCCRGERDEKREGRKDVFRILREYYWA